MDKAVIEVLSFLRKRMFFYDGLITLLVLIGAFYSWFAQTIGGRLLNLASAYGFTSEGKLVHFCFLIGFAAMELAGLIFWRHHRSVPKFKKDDLGILFAPDFDEEVEKEVNRLFVHLRQELKSHEIGNRFSLKRLPLNLSISSASEATTLLKSSRGAVAVWGPLEQQSSDKGRTTGFSKFSITFIHRPTKLSISRFVTLAMSLVGRQFHIHDETQITDRHIMARDIGLVVRNALGVKLLIDNQIQQAIKVLGPLHIDLQSTFPGKRSVPLQRFCLQVQYDFAYSLNMAISQEYKRFLFKDNLYNIPTNILQGWLNNIDQALSLDPQNSIHYISRGIYLFLLGDVEGAVRAEKKAERLAPKALSAPNFSLAFLYNFTGKFKLSRDQYRIGLAKKTSYEEDMIIQCINFTRQSIANYPEKKQLHLALAVLELRRGSKEHGILALEKLLSNAPNEPELQGFIREAKSLLLQAKSNGSIDNGSQ